MKAQLPKGKEYVPNAVTTGDDIITPDEMFDLLVERLAKVTLEAWKNRKTAAYSNAFGRAVVGHCRRSVFTDGSAAMWGDTYTVAFEELEAGNDTGVELLYIYDDSDKVMGIIANLACPAQSVQHRLFISPDFWGEVKERVRKYFGENTYLLPLCAISGDQCPIDLIRYVEPESEINDPNIIRNNPPKRNADPSMLDIEGMKKIGKRVANEIIDVYEDKLKITKEAEFKHNIRFVQLPLRTVTYDDVNKAKSSLREYINNKDGDLNYNDTAYLNDELGVLARFQLQEYMDTMEAEVHTIRLGDIVIVTNPFEPFIKYGNQIKARSVAQQTFTVQLACGFEGYIPTEKAEKGGHYSAFVASGLVGHIGGDILVRETLNEIKKVF